MKTEDIICIGIFAAIVLFVVWWKVFRKRAATVTPEDQSLIDQIMADSFHTVTPAGVYLMTGKPPSDVLVESVDAEVASFVEIQNRLGYQDVITGERMTVLVFPSVRDYASDGSYCPSFKVYFGPGDAYDESMYDQEPGKPGGWTFAAEEVLDLEYCKFVIAESEDPTFIRSAVHNGLDHVVLYHNDRARYEATKSHANGGSHPILT